MGILIYANNSDEKFSCGYSDFLCLRINIANAYDKEFGKHYESIRQCFNEEQYDKFNATANQILSDSRFKDEDSDIIDFLFASDCGNFISYKTCLKIYNLIKDANYIGSRLSCSGDTTERDYERFKLFLKDCYSHRRNMRWG